MPIKKILLCTDGSQYAEVCCRFAVWLAKRLDGFIESLYVSDIRQFEWPIIADLSGSLGIQPYQDAISQLQELEKQKATFIRSNTEAIFQDQEFGEQHNFNHETGILVDCMEKFNSSIDLVMLGKRGENVHLASEHLGSNMERVIRASKKPCMVTPRAFQPISKVLLAYDDSFGSQKALKFLTDSSIFKDLEFHLVTVDETSTGGEVSLTRLKKAEELLCKAGIVPTCQMLNGTPEGAIAEYVEAQDISLLAMGAYGHSRIRRLLIGSTTTALIRSCHIPVLLMR